MEQATPRAKIKRYPMWPGFERLAIPGKSQATARCLTCSTEIQSAEPSRHLLAHALACKNFPDDTLRNLSVAIHKDPGNRSFTPRKRSSPCADDKACTCPCMCGARGDEEFPAELVQALLMALTTFIVCTGSAFRLVENETFRAFIRILCPKFPFPSRQRVATSLLTQVHDAERELAIEELKGVPFATS